MRGDFPPLTNYRRQLKVFYQTRQAEDEKIWADHEESEVDNDRLKLISAAIS